MGLISTNALGGTTELGQDDSRDEGRFRGAAFRASGRVYHQTGGGGAGSQYRWRH